MSSTRLSTVLTVGLAVGLTAVTAACGSSGSSASSPKAAQAAAQGSAKKDCSSVPASRVNAALGTSVSDPTKDTAGNAVVCAFPQNGNPMAVIIRFEADSTLDEMQTVRKQGDATGVKSTDVSGLGDAAYSSEIDAPGVPPVATVVAQRGGLNVQVTAPVSVDVIKTLVAQLIG